MYKIAKNKKVESTSLSDFVRNTSAEDKKKIYIRALEKANESQQKILKQAAAIG